MTILWLNKNNNDRRNRHGIKDILFFSGAGFLDLGFEKEKYEVVFVNEYSNEFLKAYKFAREKWE